MHEGRAWILLAIINDVRLRNAISHVYLYIFFCNSSSTDQIARTAARIPLGR